MLLQRHMVPNAVHIPDGTSSAVVLNHIMESMEEGK